MPELRQDPVTGRRVIIAGNRDGRPEEFRRAPVARVEVDCPFCRGQEHQTTPAVATYGPADAPPEAWEVRVVSNKYPALTADGPGQETPHGAIDVQATNDAHNSSRDPIEEALFIARPGFGRHEVVIESPRHVESFSSLSDDQAFWTFAAYRDRLRAHRGEGRFAAASVFKNVGPEGGASLLHAHSQILTLPETPEFLAREVAGAANFQLRHGECVFCAILRRETELEIRLVAQTERLTAISPYAAGFAFETWILPRRHEPRFEETSDQTLREAALLVRQVIRAMETMLDRPAYNFFLHTSPFDTSASDHYHWHIELFPRIAKAAGFEWSSGWRLNTVPPERAARLLRSSLSEL